MASTPALTVLLDDGTGTFPIDISNRVLSAEGFEISRGRDDWQGAVTAGELRLSLNNSDGFLSAGVGFDVSGFDTAPFDGAPLLAVDRRIRILESVSDATGLGLGGFGGGGFGGSAVLRFTGYVKSIPVSWPAIVPTFSEVVLTATDAQARAERRTLRSMLEEEILVRSPTAYYTLGEPEGSTSAGDTSGSGAQALTAGGSGTAVTFGAGTGPVDGLTAATFANGQYLTDGVTGSSTPPLTFGLGVAFATTTTPSQPAPIVQKFGWRIYVDTFGILNFSGPATGLISSGVSVVNGATHTAFAVGDGATASLVLDGTVVATTLVSSTTPQPAELTVGGNGSGFTQFTGTVSHVAAFPALTTLDASKIAAVATGGVTEAATTRIARLASYANLTTGTLDVAATNVVRADTSGQSAQEALQEVADAEMGLVFVDGSGNLAFHNRNRAASKSAPDLVVDSQYLTTDVAPVTDDQRLVNYVEATAAGTGGVSLALDRASEDAHGRYAESQTYLVQTDAEAKARADWIVGKLAEPDTRYGTLTINLYKMPPAQAANVLAILDLDCWLRVTSMPSVANPDGATADVMVQGFREEATGESWTLTCNVVSRSLFTALMLDDATFGALDSQPILF